MKDAAAAAQYRRTAEVIGKANAWIQIVAIRQIGLSFITQTEAHRHSRSDPEIGLHERRAFELIEFKQWISLVDAVLLGTARNEVFKTGEFKSSVEILAGF